MSSKTSRLYQVQSIRAHKEVGGQKQYLVHWKKYGDDHDSWEPMDNLKGCDKIIEEYEMKVKRQSTPKRQTRARVVTRMVTPAARRSSRLAMLNTAPKEDSDAESNKDFDVKHSMVDNNDEVADQAPTEAKDLVQEKKRTQQIKRRSQPNVMIAEDADKEKKRVYKRRSHTDLVATGNLIENIIDDSLMPKSYDLRQRVQPMVPPLHPVPSTSVLLSSDEEAEILSRHPVRRGRPPHRKSSVALDPTEDNDKPYTVVKSVSKYRVSVQEGNLLVRKQIAKEPTEAATFKQDEEVKPAEPIISDVEEEETVTPSQTVASAAAATTTTTTTATFPPAPKWMYFNCAEFLLALLITALLFITYWCWNSDVC